MARPPGDGSVACPSVTLAVASTEAEIRGSVGVSAGRSDAPDPAGPVIYSWTASAGTFADASAAATTYTCPRAGRAGPQTIALSAARGPCSVDQQVVVICADPNHPDIGSGGTPGTAGVGGASGAGGLSSDPDGGEPGPTDAGSATDAPADGQASADARGGPPLVCGTDDSTVDEGTACNQCTLGNCATLESVGPRAVVTAGCHHLASDEDRVRCEQLYCCMRAHQCVIAGDPTSCWCGDADPISCALGTEPANGPCLAEMQAAAGTTDPTQIEQLQVNPSLPIGGAINLAICRANYCSSPPSPACAGFPN